MSRTHEKVVDAERRLVEAMKKSLRIDRADSSEFKDYFEEYRNGLANLRKAQDALKAVRPSSRLIAISDYRLEAEKIELGTHEWHQAVVSADCYMAEILGIVEANQ